MVGPLEEAQEQQGLIQPSLLLQQQLQALREILGANRKEQRGAAGALMLSPCPASHPPHRGPEITL